MKFDLHHNVGVSPALNTAVVTADGTGLTIDTKGYESLEFVIQSGTITDGSYVFSLQDGDASNMSDAAAVSASLTLGSASFAATDDNKAKRLGYIGKKRYVRLSIDQTGASSGGTFTATAVLGNPWVAPVAD